MISKKKKSANDLMTGLNELETELISTKDRLTGIKDIAKTIREKEVHIAKNKMSNTVNT